MCLSVLQLGQLPRSMSFTDRWGSCSQTHCLLFLSRVAGCSKSLLLTRCQRSGAALIARHQGSAYTYSSFTPSNFTVTVQNHFAATNTNKSRFSIVLAMVCRGWTRLVGFAIYALLCSTTVRVISDAATAVQTTSTNTTATSTANHTLAACTHTAAWHTGIPYVGCICTHSMHPMGTMACMGNGVCKGVVHHYAISLQFICQALAGRQ